MYRGADGSQGPSSTPPALWTTTALPASPVHGQEILYQNPNMTDYSRLDNYPGSIWRLRYNAFNPTNYKWEFIDGTPLTVAYLTSHITGSFATATWTSPAGTKGMSIPLPGTYDVEMGGSFKMPAACLIAISTKSGTYNSPAPVLGTNSAEEDAPANQFVNITWRGRVTCTYPGAGNTIDLVVYQTGAVGNLTRRGCWWTITPVSVG